MSLTYKAISVRGSIHGFNIRERHLKGLLRAKGLSCRKVSSDLAKVRLCFQRPFGGSGKSPTAEVAARLLLQSYGAVKVTLNQYIIKLLIKCVIIGVRVCCSVYEFKLSVRLTHQRRWADPNT